MKIFPKLLCIGLLSSYIMISCDKDDKEQIQEPELTSLDILTKRVDEVIPEKYLDSLKKWGLPINTGTTPPNLSGTFEITPVVLKKSSILDENSGKIYKNAMFQVKNQNNEDFSIDFYGKDLMGNRDTSIVTGISGSENKFTVYGKVKSTYQKTNVAIFGIILSGELEGENIKNLSYGIINIDGSKAAKNTFIEEGQGRIFYDSNFKSEKIRDFFFTNAKSNTNDKMLRAPKIMPLSCL